MAPELKPYEVTYLKNVYQEVLKNCHTGNHSDLKGQILCFPCQIKFYNNVMVPIAMSAIWEMKLP